MKQEKEVCQGQMDPRVRKENGGLEGNEEYVVHRDLRAQRDRMDKKDLQVSQDQLVKQEIRVLRDPEVQKETGGLLDHRDTKAKQEQEVKRVLWDLKDRTG